MGTRSHAPNRAAGASLSGARLRRALDRALWASFFLLIALVFSRSLEIQFTLPKLLVLRALAPFILLLSLARFRAGEVKRLPRSVFVSVCALAGWWLLTTAFAVDLHTALDGAHGRYNGLIKRDRRVPRAGSFGLAGDLSVGVVLAAARRGRLVLHGRRNRLRPQDSASIRAAGISSAGTARGGTSCCFGCRGVNCRRRWFPYDGDVSRDTRRRSALRDART